MLQDICNHVSSQGVDSEIVNVLQGRIEEDVFMHHYNRPDLDTVFVKVRNSIESLEKLVVKIVTWINSSFLTDVLASHLSQVSKSPDIIFFHDS